MSDSITCPRCHMTSYHPKDIQYGYCGNCRDWTSGPLSDEDKWILRAAEAEGNADVSAGSNDKPE